MLRLILLLWTIYSNNPNLRASDPHSEIPSLNYFLSLSIDLFCSALGKLLFLTFDTKFYRDVPSIIYNGSITFPLDFDILLPSESHTKGWSNTSLKGNYFTSQRDIITILATQKNRISWPVSKIEFGKNYLKSLCYLFGHFRGEKGKSPELNQVSNTSGSWCNYISSLEIPSLASAFV